jgi:hypothetical protein
MDGQQQSAFLANKLQDALPYLVGALHRAYRDAADSRAQFAGANEVTFGTEVYQFGVYELNRVSKGTRLLEILNDEEPKFRFKIGDLIFACHKVGRRRDDDIAASFPRARGASSMVEPQLSLPGISVGLDGPALQKTTRVVVAHMGNHEEGLCAVYLCVASGDAEDEKIRGWAHSECIWKRGAPGALTPAETPAPMPRAPGLTAAHIPLPEAEMDAEPRRRTERKRHDRPRE